MWKRSRLLLFEIPLKRPRLNQKKRLEAPPRRALSRCRIRWDISANKNKRRKSIDGRVPRPRNAPCTLYFHHWLHPPCITALWYTLDTTYTSRGCLKRGSTICGIKWLVPIGRRSNLWAFCTSIFETKSTEFLYFCRFAVWRFLVRGIKLASIINNKS